ncbi:hypothetical protein [Flavobacterium sp. ZS1P14]
MINKLELKLLDIDVNKDSIDDLLDDGIENLLTLHESYKGGVMGTV